MIVRPSFIYQEEDASITSVSARRKYAYRQQGEEGSSLFEPKKEYIDNTGKIKYN